MEVEKLSFDNSVSDFCLRGGTFLIGLILLNCETET